MSWTKLATKEKHPNRSISKTPLAIYWTPFLLLSICRSYYMIYTVPFTPKAALVHRGAALASLRLAGGSREGAPGRGAPQPLVSSSLGFTQS